MSNQPPHSPSHPPSSAATEDCEVCMKFRDESPVINICFEVDQHLFEDVVELNKHLKAKEFFKALNALLNAGSGFVYVHTETPSLLAQFDMQVDFKMNSLIADDSLFHHNFYRYYHDDKHVCFSVKQHRRVHISTLCFNSKVSFNSCLADPTPAQIRQLLKSVVESKQSGSQAPEESETSDHLETSLTELIKDGPVRIRTSGGIVDFNENVCTQAKDIKNKIKIISNREEFVKELIKEVWKKSSDYITAFSKIHSGGSIYFGLAEVPLVNEGTSQNDKKKGKKSKTFKCKGVAIKQQEQEEIKRMVELKVREEMLFFAKREFRNPVSVVFYPVKGEEDLSVIEVKVSQFDGLVINSKSGPESYTWNRRTKKCDVMPPDEWINHHNSEFSPRRPS